MEFTTKPNKVASYINYLKESGKLVTLYGAGYCGYEAYTLLSDQGIEVVAVSDDFHVGDKFFDLRVVSIYDIIPNERTVILITSGYYDNMCKKLSALGLLPYYEKIDFGRYDFEKENVEYFQKHESEIERAYTLLKDEKSKRCLQNLVNYRISRDLDYLQNMQESNQYFPREQVLDLSTGGGQIFLDLGAFDGDTIDGFIKYMSGKYKKIIAVEASEANYIKLKQKTSTLSDIEYHKIGIYREKGELTFFVGDAKNSFASKDGNKILPVDTVDNILAGQPVTFVKMDIEGAEYDAILGMENTLRRYCPVLAVSIYHKVEDLWRLELLIEDMCPGKYDFFIRHYSPTVIETVLYAVPRRNE